MDPPCPLVARLPASSCIDRWRWTTVVIGIDCHKATLSACAVDALGAEVAAAAFRNTAAGHVELLGWARALGGRCTRSPLPRLGAIPGRERMSRGVGARARRNGRRSGA